MSITDRLLDRVDELEAQLADRKDQIERLINGCIVEEYRPATYVGYGGWGYRWRFEKKSGFCWARDQALAELRAIAKLPN